MPSPPAPASGCRTLGTPKALGSTARTRAPNFPGGGRAAGAGLTSAAATFTWDEEEVPAAPQKRRSRPSKLKSRQDVPGPPRAQNTPQRRGRAHPGLSPQAAIRQGRATVPARFGTGSLACHRAGTRSSAASGARGGLCGVGAGQGPGGCDRRPPEAPGAEQSCPARVQR